MKLSKVLSILGIEVQPKYDRDIATVSADSRRVTEGGAFVCIRGARYDGHDFIDDAYRRGARSFFCEREISGYSDCNVIIVENTRKILAEMAFLLAGNPERELKIIAVTGTKGKSTTLFSIFHILHSLGIKAAALGTLGTLGIPRIGYDNTTPDPTVIAAAMAAARSRGAEYFILEVSSQGIKEERIHSLGITAAIFTNISHDHIGGIEHKSFVEYREQKRRLFRDFGARLAVVNSDDPTASYMADGVARRIRVGSRGADIPLTDIVTHPSGISFKLGGNFCNVNTFGEYNAYNFSLAAVTLCELLDIPLSKILPTLENIKIPGRFELISHLGRSFVIDYAHNAASAMAVLGECRKMTSGRVITVFGSVGGRSHKRRAELARAVGALSDFSVVTSDNPDFEQPENICAGIMENMPKGALAVSIVDRAAAIRYAFELSRPGDLIALLGKGHESFQLLRGEKIPYSERGVILSLRE